MDSKLTQFINCRILRDHKIIKEDLWVRKGKIINPEELFYDERVQADLKHDCNGCIIAPGFIELQINGGYGIDFSFNTEKVEEGVEYVAKHLLSHGITSFCPTVVTSPKDVYQKVVPKIKRRPGGKHGAAVLGVHAEGPFISVEKKGAHPPKCIRTFDSSFKTLEEVYGSLHNIEIITLAPELADAHPIIEQLSSRGITVSVGHSMANLNDGEEAVRKGAKFITHLFNAMLPFHHRDPGLVGLLTSDNIPKTIYFGIIADGIHTHPAALRIAHRAHPDGLVLVTDAISAIGLEDGKHNIGQMLIEVRQGKAYIAGTDTLCGSIATMIECVRFFQKATGCSVEYALEAASLHPARVLGLEQRKGNLNFCSDADFIMLNDNLDVLSTWIAGECVYDRK